MAPQSSRLSRRALLATAAVTAVGAPSQQSGKKPWSNEYWAQKGAVKLYMFRKRASAPRTGEPAPPVLLLVHGSSNSSRSSFDLATPGLGEYSVMNVFAQYGFDVWTLDHENYGRSSRTTATQTLPAASKI